VVREMVKRDIFRRQVVELAETVVVREDNGIWASFHEGFSNAARKPVSLQELLRGL
jgi:hypothetical protein